MKVPLCFHFYLLFRTNGRKEHFSEIKFYHCCGNFLKNVFSESFVQSSFLIITRHINNSIRETLQRWRFYGSTYALFLTKLNIMEQKSTKVLPWRLSVAQISKPVLQRTLHQNRRWHFTNYWKSALPLSKHSF